MLFTGDRFSRLIKTLRDFFESLIVTCFVHSHIVALVDFFSVMNHDFCDLTWLVVSSRYEAGQFRRGRPVFFLVLR